MSQPYVSLSRPLKRKKTWGFAERPFLTSKQTQLDIPYIFCRVVAYLDAKSKIALSHTCHRYEYYLRAYQGLLRLNKFVITEKLYSVCRTAAMCEQFVLSGDLWLFENGRPMILAGVDSNAQVFSRSIRGMGHLRAFQVEEQLAPPHLRLRIIFAPGDWTLIHPERCECDIVSLAGLNEQGQAVAWGLQTLLAKA